MVKKLCLTYYSCQYIIFDTGNHDMSKTKPISSVSIDRYVALALKHGEYIQNEDGTWSVKIPVLPGLITFGETKEEAKEMTEDAVRGWIEIAKQFGDEIPEIDGCIVL